MVKPLKVIVIIDVFRAFTTACHVLARSPRRYFYAKTSEAITKQKPEAGALLIGKNEVGAELDYDCPNSPYHIQQFEIQNRDIFHRSEAGATGVLKACEAGLILCASFANATATARHIRMLGTNDYEIWPMGHEATTPSLEDTICAEYIQAKVQQSNYDIDAQLPAIITGPGQYFLQSDQWQYPKHDLELCLAVDRFDFAIAARVSHDIAMLAKIH